MITTGTYQSSNGSSWRHWFRTEAEQASITNLHGCIVSLHLYAVEDFARFQSCLQHFNEDFTPGVTPKEAIVLVTGI